MRMIIKAKEYPLKRTATTGVSLLTRIMESIFGNWPSRPATYNTRGVVKQLATFVEKIATIIIGGMKFSTSPKLALAKDEPTASESMRPETPKTDK